MDLIVGQRYKAIVPIRISYSYDNSGNLIWQYIVPTEYIMVGIYLGGRMDSGGNIIYTFLYKDDIRDIYKCNQLRFKHMTPI